MGLLFSSTYLHGEKNCPHFVLNTDRLKNILPLKLSAISCIYIVFSHDVKAAILVSQNNETAAMLVSQQPAVLVGAVVKEFWKMGPVILFHGIDITCFS